MIFPGFIKRVGTTKSTNKCKYGMRNVVLLMKNHIFYYSFLHTNKILGRTDYICQACANMPEKDINKEKGKDKTLKPLQTNQIKPVRSDEKAQKKE